MMFSFLCRGLAAAVRIAAGAVMLAVFAFALAGMAQACQKDNKATTASEVVATGHRTQTHHQGALPTHMTGKQTVSVATQVRGSTSAADCCLSISGKCGGHGCGGACCTACVTALHTTDFMAPLVFGTSTRLSSIQNLLHATELDSQFRPPRSSH